MFVENFNQFCEKYGFIQNLSVQNYIKYCIKYAKKLEKPNDETHRKKLSEKLKIAQFNAIIFLNIYSYSPENQILENDYEIIRNELQKKPEEVNYIILGKIVEQNRKTIRKIKEDISPKKDTSSSNHLLEREILPPTPESLDRVWKMLQAWYFPGYKKDEFDLLKYKFNNILTYTRLEKESPPAKRNIPFFLTIYKHIKKLLNNKKTSIKKQNRAWFFFWKFKAMIGQAGSCNIEAYFLNYLKIKKQISEIHIQILDEFLQSNPKESFSKQQFIEAFYYIHRYGSQNTKRELNDLPWGILINPDLFYDDPVQFIGNNPPLLLFESFQKQIHIPKIRPPGIHIDLNKVYCINLEISFSILLWSLQYSELCHIETDLKKLRDFSPIFALEKLEEASGIFVEVTQLLIKEHQESEHKKGPKFIHFLFGSSRQLLNFYQQKQISIYLKLFEKNRKILEEVTSRLNYWLQSEDSNHLSSKEIKQIENTFNEITEPMYREYQELERYFKDHHVNLPLFEKPVISATKIDKSHSLIIHSLEEKSSEILKKDQNKTNNPQMIYLKQLSKGKILSDYELILLTTNATQDLQHLCIKREKKHKQIEKRLQDIYKDILNRKVVTKENHTILSQIIDYYRSIGHEPFLENLRYNLCYLHDLLPQEKELNGLIKKIGPLTPDWDSKIEHDVHVARETAEKDKKAFKEKMKEIKDKYPTAYIRLNDHYENLIQNNHSEERPEEIVSSCKKEDPETIMPLLQKSVQSENKRKKAENMLEKYNKIIKPAYYLIKTHQIKDLYHEFHLSKSEKTSKEENQLKS